MFVVHSSALETESIEISCSDLWTCNKCTTNARCSWSVEQQACVKNDQFNTPSLMVSEAATCPRFSVVQKYGDYRTVLQYTLVVSIGSAEIMDYLQSSNVTCGTELHHMGAAKVEYKPNNTVLCYTFISHHLRDYFTDSTEFNEPFVFFYLFVQLNGMNVKLDDEADHYLALYRRECADDERVKHCATCGWIDGDGYSNYLEWCSADNTCNGRSQLYLKLDGEKMYSELYPRDDVAWLDSDHCAAINVTAVHPLSGPRAGGTAVTIVVTNHGTLVKNGEVTVTVAGTVCADPRTSGPETITCTTTAPTATGPASGPVLVEYASPEARRAIIIRSAHTFLFVVEEPICEAPGPVLITHRKLGGIASGGTTVPVHGNHFVVPCLVSQARLYVVLANGEKRYADGYCDRPVNDTYMLCRTPQAVAIAGQDAFPSPVGCSLNFGLHVAGFATGNRSLYVSGPSHGFTVHPDPVLLDYEVDGRTGVVFIDGRYLQYVRPDEITVGFQDESANASCVVVSVTGDGAVCEPTAAVDASRQITVRIGTSLKYTVTIKRSSPHPDDPPTSLLPGWAIAVASVSLVLFVCASVWCLRSKRCHGSRETNDNPSLLSVESTDLETVM